MQDIHPRKLKLKWAREYMTPSRTQEEMAEMLKITQGTLGRLEAKGSADVPTDRTLARAADITGLPVNYFLDDLILDRPLDYLRKSRVAMAVHEERSPYARPRDLILYKLRNGAYEPTAETDTFPCRLNGGEYAIVEVARMEDRLIPGDKALIRLDRGVPPGRIALTTDGQFVRTCATNGTMCYKRLSDGKPMKEAQVLGGLAGVARDYDDHPNIEFDQGKFLK